MAKHDQIWDDPELLKKKRIIGVISIAVVLLVLVALTIVLGKPMIEAIRNKESFRDNLQAIGFWKYPIMVGIMALQVLIAFIPGEPIEIIAGYVFGGWLGMFLCLLGTALASVLIIITVRRFGMKFVSLFIKREQIENLKLFKNPKTRDATIFMLFLIPGTPKDIITYIVGLVPIHLGKYVLLTSIARIPSIITSTMGGSKLGEQEYRHAILIFVVTLVLTGIAALGYHLYQQKHPQKDDEDEEEETIALPENTVQIEENAQAADVVANALSEPVTDLPTPEAQNDQEPNEPNEPPKESDNVSA